MDDIIARLGRIDSCGISDALDKLGLPGAVSGIHRFTTDRRIAGKVLTVTMGAAQGRPPATRHLCTAAIEAANPGDVIVVEQRTGLDAACWGGNLALGAQVRGVAGVIVEGPARDIDDCRKLRLPGLRAGAHRAHCSRSASSKWRRMRPVRVGDVTVTPGDYVVADGSAVVFVPQAEILRVLEAAESIVAREEAMAEELRKGKPISQVMGTNYETMLKK